MCACDCCGQPSPATDRGSSFSFSPLAGAEGHGRFRLRRAIGDRIDDWLGERGVPLSRPLWGASVCLKSSYERVILVRCGTISVTLLCTANGACWQEQLIEQFTFNIVALVTICHGPRLPIINKCSLLNIIKTSRALEQRVSQEDEQVHKILISLRDVTRNQFTHD